jgi:hypothetical protein
VRGPAAAFRALVLAVDLVQNRAQPRPCFPRRSALTVGPNESNEELLHERQVAESP